MVQAHTCLNRSYGKSPLRRLPFRNLTRGCSLGIKKDQEGWHCPSDFQVYFHLRPRSVL